MKTFDSIQGQDEESTYILTDGMFDTLGMDPMGVGLHEPCGTWAPFVSVAPRQKSICVKKDSRE